jgi:hypothetical protein
MYANGAYFELKKVTCLPHVSSIFKKISPKTFGTHCVCSVDGRWMNVCGATAK